MFEPGARTAWHTHPLGQTLIVTAGTGHVRRWGDPVDEIRKGDVAWIPPGQKHWHGDGPKDSMTHIAITEQIGGKAVEWMEGVSDAQYNAPLRGQVASAAARPRPSQAAIGNFAPKLAEITDNVLYGDIWERPDLPKRDRSLVTVAALIAMNRPDQLRSHLRIARQNGLTEAELIETITHLAFYAGWPNAVVAVGVAREVFKEVRESSRMMKITAQLFTILIALSVTPLIGDDWPGIYGPRRDLTSTQKGLLRTWPQAGPKLLWTVPLSAGFGGAAVSGGNVYVLDRDESVGDKLRVFDLASGKELWTFAYDAPGRFMFAGSRTTPTVDGEHVYTVGALGDLYAVSTKTRKPVWRKNIWKDFGGDAELPRWAIVQNPLIYGDLLIVAPQTSEAGVVAYDKLTGALKWKSAGLSGIPGYVTPSIVKVAGEDQLVMITGAAGRGRNAKGGSVNGLDPRSGKVLWTYTNWQCIIPVPQVVDAGQGRMLITGGYSAGSAMIQIEKKSDGAYGVSELFKNPDFGSHTQPPILHQGTFYSQYTTNERNDGLVAMGMDGKVRWTTGQQPAFVRGGSILADGVMLVSDGNTKLYLVEPSPAGFKPLASAVILESGDNWAPLALTDGKLFVRGQKELKVLQVAQ